MPIMSRLGWIYARHILKLTIADIEAVIALYELGDYQRAADRLYISVSALKKRIKKTQEALGPLFVSTGTGGDAALAPLPSTKRLVERLRSDIAAIRFTLASHRDIPLNEDASTLTIGIIENLEAVLLPHIESVIHREAPNLEFRSYGLTRNQKKARTQDIVFMRQQLLRGETDLCIYLDTDSPVQNLTYPGPTEKDSFLTETLFTTEPVGITHIKHEVPDPVPFEWIKDKRKAVLSKEYLQAVLKIDTSVWEVQSIATVAALISRNPEYISVPPRVVAEELCKHYPLKIFELPPEVPKPALHAKMVWTPRADGDPTHQWFRRTLTEFSKK